MLSRGSIPDVITVHNLSRKSPNWFLFKHARVSFIYLSNCAVHYHHLCCIPLSQDLSGVTNVFLHSLDVCGVACSGGLILDFVSKLAGWERLDGKYVSSRFGGVVSGLSSILNRVILYLINGNVIISNFPGYRPCIKSLKY